MIIIHNNCLTKTYYEHDHYAVLMNDLSKKKKELAYEPKKKKFKPSLDQNLRLNQTTFKHNTFVSTHIQGTIGLNFSL